MNFTKRFVKMSHDPMDGEITMTGELWIEDMDLTRAAFDRCMSNFMECLREAADAVESVLAGRGMPQEELQPFQPPESEEGPAGEEGREAA
jgi:hypothetical protein